MTSVYVSSPHSQLKVFMPSSVQVACFVTVPLKACVWGFFNSSRPTAALKMLLASAASTVPLKSTSAALYASSERVCRPTAALRASRASSASSPPLSLTSPIIKADAVMRAKDISRTVTAAIADRMCFFIL